MVRAPMSRNLDKGDMGPGGFQIPFLEAIGAKEGQSNSGCHFPGLLTLKLEKFQDSSSGLLSSVYPVLARKRLAKGISVGAPGGLERP